MADHDELIKILNEAVALEYTAAVQYNQHSMLVTGRDRRLFEDFFEDSSKESLAHARIWGNRIVYLGGIPKPEVGAVRQSADITEMLEMDLEIEKKAVEIYTRAHRACQHEPTRYMLENHILDEDKDVEEIQKFLGRVKIAESKGATQRQASGQ